MARTIRNQTNSRQQRTRKVRETLGGDMINHYLEYSISIGKCYYVVAQEYCFYYETFHASINIKANGIISYSANDKK